MKTDKLLIETIQNRYMIILEQSIEEIYGVRYKVVIQNKYEEDLYRILKGIEDNEMQSKQRSEEEFMTEYPLNSKYSFDNFIVGESNNYAHAVALAASESIGELNPLFIYGGSGLGKTHLIHAIGNYIVEHNPSMKVLYVPSEIFASDLIQAIQTRKNTHDKMGAFKKKYRSVDVLLIDERLKSRLQWNIVADIQYPNFETKVDILIKKAEEEKISIDDDLLDVVDIIAEKVNFDIRKLESTFTNVINLSKV